jgi:hypothetical protein
VEALLEPPTDFHLQCAGIRKDREGENRK